MSWYIVFIIVTVLNGAQTDPARQGPSNEIYIHTRGIRWTISAIHAVRLTTESESFLNDSVILCSDRNLFPPTPSDVHTHI